MKKARLVSKGQAFFSSGEKQPPTTKTGGRLKNKIEGEKYVKFYKTINTNIEKTKKLLHKFEKLIFFVI